LNKVIRSKFWSLAACLLWAGLLFYAHILPGEELRLDTWWFKYHMDKWAHAFMFMIQFLLLVNLFRSWGVLKIRSLLYSSGIIVFFGATMEWIQGTLIEGRVADPLDFFADSAGILFGLLFIRIIYAFGWRG